MHDEDDLGIASQLILAIAYFRLLRIRLLPQLSLVITSFGCSASLSLVCSWLPI